MILVELVRLVIVVSLTAAAYRLGATYRVMPGVDAAPETVTFVGTVLGAGFGYVLGGVLGRSLRLAVGLVERKADRLSGAEIIAGLTGFAAGIIGGLLTSWLAIIIDLPRTPTYSATALSFVVFGYTGYRVAVRKGFELLGMAGLSQTRDTRVPVRQVASGPRILDTSVLIDGRIVDIVKAGFLSGHLVCPRFVLAELEGIASSDESSRRARGRRGLEVLESLEGEPRVKLEVADRDAPGVADVDGKLVVLAGSMQGVLVTNDFDLHRRAELQGVPVMNVNNLAAALQPVVLPGESLIVRMLRPGTREGQGVGYLDDGTMVVVEGGQELLGREVEVVVTSVLRTTNGRMIFSSLASAASEPAT